MNALNIKNWLKKLAGVVGVGGVSALLGFPALAQYYPAASFFQPAAYTFQSEDECLIFSDTASIVDNLKGNECFQTLVSYLEQSGLPETLKQEETFTIFAPMDQAFETLPAATREKLSQPENLEKVLKYHLISGAITEDDIKRGEITTIEGSSIQITGVPIGNKIAARLNQATASDTVKASNGFIVLINQVLLPPDFE